MRSVRESLRAEVGLMRGLGLLAAGIACVVVFAAGAGAANGHASYRAVCPGPVFDSGRCHAEVVTDARGNPQATSGPTGYGPAQFQDAYALPSAVAGAGQTIAIVDAYDDPNAEADLATYSSTYGLPACTTASGCFRKVDQTGGTRYPRADQGWALEISLDVQVAHAVCPNCKLLLVEAKSNSFSNLFAAEDYATAHANVVSNSWGGSEFSSETSSSYDGHFNRSGVPITVSSGDAGYGVEFPAASRYVTAVGGTTLTLKSDNTRLSETAWSGAGSGCSSYESKPAWQTNAGCATRAVADVSADADPTTGASVYDSQGYQGQRGWFKVGGTSLAAPLIAGVYALAGNATSTTYASFPYSHTGSLNDVTSGTNGSCSGSYLCTASFGYDGPTGLGTPNGTGAF
jgi:subtilase family serine protease